MKKFLLLLLILCLVASLFSCAVQNENNGSTNTATDTSANASTDTGTNTSTDTSIQASAPSTDTDLSDSSKNAKNDTQGEEKMNNFVLKGIVKGRGTHLEIEVIESDYAFGIYWVIVPNSISILDASGNEISLDSIKNGDIVNITYNGQTMLSYPPQIVALAISIEK